MKKTKIVATISDLKCDVDFIQKLYDEGMNVVRLNTAHQTHEDTLKVIKNVRMVSDKIPLLLDTKGPEIRTNKFEVERFFKKGEKVLIKGDPKKSQTKEIMYVSYSGIAKDVRVGQSILVDDGAIEFKVMKKTRDALVCKVMNSAGINGRKSVNVPGAAIRLPSLTKKDKDYIEFAAKVGIDFIAHSFVRNKKDVLAVQKILDKYKSSAKIIAKIENQEGVDNLDEILDVTYGVMVARGDLGIEVPAEKIPMVQYSMIQKCIAKKRPVIVATQMLHSMIDNPRATRAEISDIANAIRSGTDAIMLSGETAYGKYPVESVKTMTRVAREVEKERREKIQSIAAESIGGEIPAFLSKMAVNAALKLPVKAIITDTMTGRTARYVSSFRGDKIIFTQCYRDDVMRQLALSYGIYASHMDKTKTHDHFIELSLKTLLKRKDFKESDLVVVLAGNYGPTHGASFVEISTVENLMMSKKR